MFCNKCGAKITEDMRFCGNCGAPVAMQPAGRIEKTEEKRSRPAEAISNTSDVEAKKPEHHPDVKRIIGLVASILQILCITVIPRYTYKGVSYTALTSLRFVIIVPFILLAILNVLFFLLSHYKGVLICNIFCVLYALLEVGYIYLYSEYSPVTLGPALFLYPVATIAVFVGRSGHKKEKTR